MSRHDLWLRLLWAVTGLKLATALLGVFWGAPLESTHAGGATILPRLVLLIPFFAFALGGLLFLLGGRGDTRAIHLGTAFLLLATPFSNRPLLRLIISDWQRMGLPALWLSGIHVDAFLPYFVWRFVGEFPSATVTFRTRRVLDWGAGISLATGASLFIFWLGWLIRNLLQAPQDPVLNDLAPPKPGYAFYTPVLAFSTAALLLLLARTRATAAGEEKRRARVFVLGLAGLVPFFVLFLVTVLFPPLVEILFRPAAAPFYAIPFILFSSVPFTTGYAVLVHHVLDVKLIARRAMQYALARYTALSLATVPLVAIAVYLYNHKEQPLTEIFSGSKILLLLSAALVGGAALRYRATLLDSIDRRFFREQYDARQILTHLVERIRGANDVPHLADLLSRQIDRALHLEGISLLSLDLRSSMLIDSRTRSRRLDASSALGQTISNASDPLAVDLDNPHSPLLKLPEAEQHWLVDNGFKLLVPILGRDGSLIGLLGLGEKKSGLPFLKEDRQLLHAIASNSAWLLESEQSRSFARGSWRDTSSSSSSTGSKSDGPMSLPEEPLPATEVAKECPACGTLYPSYTVLCNNDSHRLEPSHVPYVLPGKFRFERRIGAGGMGVVYRGFDLALGRLVAVKTLRRVSPEDAMRLRREARTAAAVSHLHLAAVYGMETWQGTPMLVLELLEGGTLGQRVEARGKLPPREMVDLGIDMAEALAKLHASDILHRDLKPSNIGFTKDSIPKLMDFGIARVMFDLRRDADSTGGFDDLDESASILPPTSIWHQTPTSLSVSRQLVGTLSYLSPEALNGEPADVSFDLWGLAIVLYETLIGRKVFTGGEVRQLMNRIKSGRVPDFSQVCPEHDDVLGDFFRSALHRNVARRPETAKEFKRQLEAVKERLATAR
ncbi:MAG TPA: serine/threonine-protein kinase [Thermoanaerobaculia bacterium]|nr:serine/threonine-protein kinase [Thermoanaerobaculia bacterium]